MACHEYMVHFATGGVLMEQKDMATINAVTLLAADADAMVYLVGKTDTVGSKAANMRLSRQRADKVHNALVDNGVLPARIVTSYTGKLAPVVATGDQDDEPLNRVVTITAGKNCPPPKA